MPHRICNRAFLVGAAATMLVVALESPHLGIDGATAAAQQPANQVAFEAGDVHLDNSRVFTFVGKTGLGHEHAIEGRLKSGTIQFDQGSGKLVFDIASFTADTDVARTYIGLAGTTSASTQQQVTTNMLGTAVLDAARFPNASFEITAIAPVAEKSQRGLPQFQLDGKFTLHGTVRPLRIVADVEEKNGWLHLRGGFNIRQTQFGIRPFSKAFGTIGVADQLTIYGDLWLAKERASYPR